jgi:sulfotransferase family protein
MIYGARWVVKYLLGRDIAGRLLAVYPDDTFIVSYPRSGNTWTRFLVANLLRPKQAVSFANIERLVPDCEASSSRYLRGIARPRVIKSHEYFDHRYKKVIYIVRDPRDVVLSYYDFDRKYRHIDDAYPFESYVRDFVKGKLSSADWGTWGENVGSWISTRNGHEGFLLLRYEDMLDEPALAVSRMAAFFHIEVDEARIQTIVTRSSAQEMRGMEKLQASEWVSTKNKRSDIPFVRSAVAGDWRSKLGADSIAEIEAAWGPLMVTLGYTLVNSTSQECEKLPAHGAALHHELVLTRERI